MGCIRISDLNNDGGSKLKITVDSVNKVTKTFIKKNLLSRGNIDTIVDISFEGCKIYELTGLSKLKNCTFSFIDCSLYLSSFKDLPKNVSTLRFYRNRYMKEDKYLLKDLPENIDGDFTVYHPIKEGISTAEILMDNSIKRIGGITEIETINYHELYLPPYIGKGLHISVFTNHLFTLKYFPYYIGGKIEIRQNENYGEANEMFRFRSGKMIYYYDADNICDFYKLYKGSCLLNGEGYFFDPKNINELLSSEYRGGYILAFKNIWDSIKQDYPNIEINNNLDEAMEGLNLMNNLGF